VQPNWDRSSTSSSLVALAGVHRRIVSDHLGHAAIAIVIDPVSLVALSSDIAVASTFSPEGSGRRG
jgi:hypothetical protein